MKTINNNFDRKELITGGLLIFAVVFNAFLAFVNQNILSVNTSMVIGCEMLIVAAVFIIAITNFSKEMYPWLYLAGGFFVIALVVGMLNDSFNPKNFRDMLLITTFGLLGICYKNYNIIPLFKWLAIIVVGVMLFEAFATESFSAVFNPASYFFSSRGTGDFESEAGIFKNALSFEGRFSLGIFGTHRLSSVFMEQTTLGNFAIILGMFTSVFWGSLQKTEKILFCVSIFLIIAGTNSRLAIGNIACFIVLHNLVKYLPRYTNIIYVPIFLIGTALVFYDPQLNVLDDNFSGRIAWNIHILSQMTVERLLGMDVASINIAWDSGYSYTIIAQSIFGLLLFILFTSLILPQTTIQDKRLAHMISFFMVFTLAVGPTIFSIKTAAPLWFLVGYVYARVQNKA